MLEGVYQSFVYPPNGAPHLPPPPPSSAYPDNPVEPQVQHYGGLNYRDQYAYRGAGYYTTYQSPSSSSSSVAGYEAPSPVFPDHRTAHHNSDPNYYAPPASNASSSAPGWQVRPPGVPWTSSPPARPLPLTSAGGYIGARGGDLDMNSPTRGQPISPPGFGPTASLARPKLTTTVWEDEGTVCYQVDAKGICVARRADNEMVNGTKLLNVVGMSRGKRDGILKNEKDRVVIKVGAMHLKGVWITLRRAKYLATKFRICDLLYPLFEDDPKKFVYSTAPPTHPGSAAAAAAGVSSPPASVASSRRPSSLLDNSPDSLSNSIRSSFNDFPAGKRGSLPSIPSMSALDQQAVTSRLSPPHQLPTDTSSLADHEQQPSTPSTTLPAPNTSHSYSGLNYYYHHQYEYSRPPPPPPPPSSFHRLFSEESKEVRDERSNHKSCVEVKPDTA